MKKVMFINLYDFSSLKRIQTPLGLLSLYFILKNKTDYDVEICDFNDVYYEGILKDDSFQKNIDCMVDYIIGKKPDIISVYTMCNNYHIALFLCKAIRTKNPNIITLLAGPHATMVAEETLSGFDSIDYIGLGEGEETIVPILNGIFNNNVEGIVGLAYRDGEGKIIANWNSTDIADIENLEVIDFTKVGVEADKIREIGSVDIEGGRGCPFRCAFCSTQKFWGNHFRVKSIPKIISEVEFYMEKLQIKDFNFQHDLFTFNKKYILEFCDEIIKRKMNITWKCSARIDTVDREMLLKMSESGCVGIFFGVETGSKTVQRAVNKNLKLEKVDQVLKGLIESNITAVFSFIYGFPTELGEDLNDTLTMIHRIKKSNITRNFKGTFLIELWPLAFLPGTSMGQNYYDDLKFNEFRGMDFNNSDYTRCPEVNDLVKENKKIFLNFYSIEKNSTVEFKFLNVFIMYLFNFCYSFIYEAMDLIIEHYNNNILEMYLDFFKYNRDEVISFFQNKTIGGILPKYDELGDFFSILDSFIGKSPVCKNASEKYPDTMKTIKSYASMFQGKSNKNSQSSGNVQASMYKVLERRYPKLLLPVEKGMSATEVYRDVVSRGKVYRNSENLFITSDKDFMMHLDTRSEQIELIYMHNRADYKRFIQVMAYRCEPVQIPDKSNVFVLNEVTNWEKIREYKKEYVRLGGNEWEKELETFMSNRKNYTETVIVCGQKSGEAPGYPEHSPDSMENIQFNAKIRLFQQLSSYLSSKNNLKTSDKLTNRLLNDCVALILTTGRYDKDVATAMVNIKNGECFDTAKLQKYITESETIEGLVCKAFKLTSQLEDIAGSYSGDLDDAESLMEHIYLNVIRTL
ncbi:radical SAM protein [Clostridium sp. BNL1100]|uniref:B12-binding domain-containing radical SAM protein n=1 Tax=Clostridium sp. BNL1100 TaxID=755731 RepID=UPI00024A7699|nr:radical SAM protein [Clostridium sp. BNL1100]AEY64766.1 Fe-S oxidoreductase [Clostridium sp. BNL1100]